MTPTRADRTPPRRGVRPGWVLAVGALVVAMVVVVLGLTGGWGASPQLDEVDLGAAGARSADGVWSLQELAPGGTPVELVDAVAVVLRLDTSGAVLHGTSGCNELLGSFTLHPSGSASFTTPSARVRSCGPALDAQETHIRHILDHAGTWEVSSGRLVLSGPAGYLALQPVP